MPSVRQRSAALSAVLLALVGAVAIAAPASAHSTLVGSSPEEGETVTELTEVALEFNEQLLEIGNEVALEAPDGTRTALTPDEDITETLTAPVPDGVLQEGVNTIAYRVVSADGHPIEGEIAFTYAPENDAASPTASAEASATPTTTASSTPSASAEPSAAATPLEASPSPSATGVADQSEGLNPAIYLGLGALGAGAIALIAVVTARRRGSGDAPAE